MKMPIFLPQSLFYGVDDQSWFSELFQSFWIDGVNS
jgi:hypothetical protein